MKTQTSITEHAIDVTGDVGTELVDIQLKELNQAQIDDVKNLVAERGVLFFRDQEMTLEDQLAVGRKLGQLHEHPAAKAPDGYPEVLEIHTDANSVAAAEVWHNDVSCDERPPALSMLRMETVPSVGGDTLFASMYKAYETLSPVVQEFLYGLTAVHSGQVYKDDGGEYDAGIYREDRKIPESAHPVVLTHPVTGRRALYVNSLFTREIQGLLRRESDALLKMLYDHVAYRVAAQVRFRWAVNSVALWDNRCVQHHATWDYFPETRHGYRVTTVGSRPQR